MEVVESFGDVHSHPIAVAYEVNRKFVIRDMLSTNKLQRRVGSVKVGDRILARHFSNFWTKTTTRLISCTHGDPAGLGYDAERTML